jgi:hypothetical protein
VQAERHPGLLAWSERYSGKAGQLGDRSGDLGDGVIEVELDDLGAAAGPGVADEAGNVEFPVGRGLLGTQAQVGVVEGRVGQAVAEGEQRGWGRGC